MFYIFLHNLSNHISLNLNFLCFPCRDSSCGHSHQNWWSPSWDQQRCEKFLQEPGASEKGTLFQFFCNLNGPSWVSLFKHWILLIFFKIGFIKSLFLVFLVHLSPFVVLTCRLRTSAIWWESQRIASSLWKTTTVRGCWTMALMLWSWMSWDASLR